MYRENILRFSTVLRKNKKNHFYQSNKKLKQNKKIQIFKKKIDQ